MVRIWGEKQKVDGYDHAMPTFNEIKAYVQDYLKVRPSGA